MKTIVALGATLSSTCFSGYVIYRLSQQFAPINFWEKMFAGTMIMGACWFAIGVVALSTLVAYTLVESMENSINESENS